MTADVCIMMVNSEPSGCAEKACLQMDAKLPIEVDSEIMSGSYHVFHSNLVHRLRSGPTKCP